MIKNIIGYEGVYTISDKGKVFSIKRKRYINCSTVSGTGYQKFDLYKHGKRTCLTRAKLLLNHFKPRMLEEGKLVDHIDGNRVNDNLSNLRWATYSQNAVNRGKLKIKNSKKTKYFGICWVTGKKKWKVSARINGKAKFFGYFDSEIEAAKVSDEVRLKIYGAYARLNFQPKES